MKATSLPNGKPESEQLAALWDKYDPDGKWELSKEKLKLILQDQARAKVEILQQEIPKVKTSLKQTKPAQARWSRWCSGRSRGN